MKADVAILAGQGGKEPTGVVDQPDGRVPGPISIDALINASGLMPASAARRLVRIGRGDVGRAA